MNKVLVDREDIEAVRNTLANGGGAVGVLRWAKSVLAQPAEAEGVEAVEFWVLFDATTPEPYIKKMMPEGFLAFFDHEEDAIRAKSFHPGTDYKRVPYVRQSAHIAALSAVTAERDRLRDQVKVLQSDANSWQSGYDKGRNDGTKHRKSEVDQLRAEVETLQSQERYREQDLAVVIEQRDHYANRVLHLETSVLRIAGDYQPSSDAESVLALDEMRAALVGLVGAAMAAKEA